MLTCYSCHQRITSRDNVNVLAFLGVKLRAFCSRCYSARERGISRHFFYIPKYPINGAMYTLGLSLLALLWLFLLGLGGYSFFSPSGSSYRGMLIPLVLISLVLVWQGTLWILARRKIKEVAG